MNLLQHLYAEQFLKQSLAIATKNKLLYRFTTDRIKQVTERDHSPSVTFTIFTLIRRQTVNLRLSSDSRQKSENIEYLLNYNDDLIICNPVMGIMGAEPDFFLCEV